jgi:hypothetical protein
MQQPEINPLVTTLPKPIKWIVPDSIRTDHATHLIVQQQGSEFTFLFFETESLLYSGTPEEQIAAYKSLPEIKAKCIAKIVMSAENATLAANNLIESLNRFNVMLQAVEGQENASTGTQESTKLSASHS